MVEQTFSPPADSVLWCTDFLMGAATAADQIEGAIDEDGRLASIWDTGEFACDVCRGTSTDSGPVGPRAARLFELQHNNCIFDPLLKRSYPSALWELWPDAEPVILNGYTEVDFEGVERTQMGWEVCPDGLRHLLVGFHRDYPNLPPIYITENGMATDDVVIDDEVHDHQRISFLNRHLEAVKQAVKTGVDVRGDFIWSLPDNFEWAFGYERRFGIIHVDYATQKRTLKRSAKLDAPFLAERAARN